MAVAHFIRLAATVLLASWLTGCGTFVPRLTERLDEPDDLSGELMVGAIVRSVRCELRRGVTTAVNEAVVSARAKGSRQTYAEFLENWGAEVAITLTIAEKTTINPNGTFTPPSPASTILTITGGAAISTEAIRIEKLNFFYTVKELYMRDGEVCDATREQRRGSLLVQNDLKIDTVLRSRINSIALGQAAAPTIGRQNVLSHQVTFEAVFQGNITPTIRLVRATINPDGPLFDASRNRTHDLIITFGPLDKRSGGQSLISIAEQSHFTSQITSGFRTAIPR